MAKKTQKIEYSKEQMFDELLQKSWYFKEVYSTKMNLPIIV